MAEDKFAVEPDDVGKEDVAKLVPHVVTIVFKSGTELSIHCQEFSLEHRADGTIASASWKSNLIRGDDQLLWLCLADISAVYTRGASK